MPLGDLAGRALEKIEEATGQTVVSAERLELLEAVATDYRMLNRELEDIGWNDFDYRNGKPQEQKPEERRKMVARARKVWANDPQAGAAAELMNDFVFGRGVPKPRAKDAAVQDVIDAFWSDPDNEAILTTYDAQTAIGVDLTLQSNLFVLGFDDGLDGVFKLSLLAHDDVWGTVTDPDKRHRVLYYLAYPSRNEWDYKQHQWKPSRESDALNREPTYYAHWRNVELAQKERGRETPVEGPDAKLLGKGKVYHVRINRGSEQDFGVPRYQRTLRWLSAYNEFMKARVDVAQAAAAFIMKRKVKGDARTLGRDAAKLLSRRSPLGAGLLDQNVLAGVRPASILEENESVSHEPLVMDSRSSGAMQDAQMLRAPFSAAERFPQSYFGDATNSSLATATSLELPVLKAVESRQEVFEQLFRWAIDRAIERAVDSGKLTKKKTAAELAKEKEARQGDQPQPPAGPQAPPAQLEAALLEAAAAGDRLVEVARVRMPGSRAEVMLVTTLTAEGALAHRVVEAYEGQTKDEGDTERDLGYEFSMPSPLRRMMTDLTAAITGIAQSFDPNNSNVELSRVLLTIALGEALEVQDPSDLVEKIFPEGYQDPAVVMAQQQAAGAGGGFGAQDQGQPFPAGPDSNAYGAPMNASPPGQQYGSLFGADVEEGYARELSRYIITKSRNGSPVVWGLAPGELEEALAPAEPRLELEEVAASVADRDERAVGQSNGNAREADEEFSRDVVGAALAALDRATLLDTSRNGHR